MATRTSGTAPTRRMHCCLTRLRGASAILWKRQGKLSAPSVACPRLPDLRRDRRRLARGWTLFCCSSAGFGWACPRRCGGLLCVLRGARPAAAHRHPPRQQNHADPAGQKRLSILRCYPADERGAEAGILSGTERKVRMKNCGGSSAAPPQKVRKKVSGHFFERAAGARNTTIFILHFLLAAQQRRRCTSTLRSHHPDG